jgi:hypothetical protein
MSNGFKRGHQVGKTQWDTVQVFYIVAVENRRPAVSDDIPPAYRELMEQCWETDPEKRPPFTEVLRRITAMWESARLDKAAAKAGVRTPESPYLPFTFAFCRPS